ncbi:hypothetical protein DB88DRAFT_427242, partial [Papiliotrema laurentii]
SLLCDRCSEYVFNKGKKFRARKETAEGDEYYRIEMFRSTWLIAAPSPLLITLWTDPKSGDCIREQGATPNFNNWSD